MLSIRLALPGPLFPSSNGICWAFLRSSGFLCLALLLVLFCSAFSACSILLPWVLFACGWLVSGILVSFRSRWSRSIYLFSLILLFGFLLLSFPVSTSHYLSLLPPVTRTRGEGWGTAGDGDGGYLLRHAVDGLLFCHRVWVFIFPLPLAVIWGDATCPLYLDFICINWHVFPGNAAHGFCIYYSRTGDLSGLSARVRRSVLVGQRDRTKLIRAYPRFAPLVWECFA